MQMGNAVLTNRMIRAAKLESGLYEEVEHDQSATTQALTVVIVAALASGIGGGLALLTLGIGGPGFFVLGLVRGIISALVSWVIWSAVVYYVGTNLFGGKATLGEVLRTMGFAQTPQILNILLFVPGLNVLIGLVAFVWVLVAVVIAIRQSLDVETNKAIITGVIAFVCVAVVSAILGRIGLGLSVLGG